MSESQKVKGTVREISWLLGEATAVIQGDDGRTYVYLVDGSMKLCVGSRVSFVVKEPPAPPVYTHTPGCIPNYSVADAIELEVLGVGEDEAAARVKS